MNKTQVEELINIHKCAVKKYEDSKKDTIRIRGDKIKKMEDELNDEKRKLEEDSMAIIREKFYIKILEDELKRYEEYFKIIREKKEEHMKKKIDEKLKDTDTIYFKGCDNCNKWDGISKRCHCGNRRVEWVWNDCGDIEPEIY